MNLSKRLGWLLPFSILLMGCAAEPSEKTDSNGEMARLQSEHMEHCVSRREYQSRDLKKIEKHCRCVFTTAMRGLSDDEQFTAAFYLYGETDKAFKERFRANPPDLDAMGPAIEAVAKAAKTCRL